MGKWRFIFSVTIAAFGAIAAAAPEEPAKIVVTLGAVEEHRTLVLKEPDVGKSDPFDKGGIWLKLEGEALRDATTYVNLRVDESADERGRQLIPPSNPGLMSIEWPVLFATSGADKPPAIQLSISLPRTSRATRSIPHLRGTVDIRLGAEPFPAVFGNLRKMLDKPLRDPALTALGGFEPQISHPPSGATNAVRFSATGDAVMLASVEILDSGGKVIGRARPQRNPPPLGFWADIQLPRPVDDAMSLRLNLYRKTKLITVPFHLTDITLP